MGTLKKDFKYKKVENFLSQDEIDLIRKYCISKHIRNFDSFDCRQNNNGDTYFYKDPLMQSLLAKKLPLMEKETGLKLFPTYSFFRLYTLLSDLKKHSDRPSCEVSVTVMLGSDGTQWPIYMDGKPVDLNPGDACIYLGCELEHWREPFEGDWHLQTFLHYVDQNGPHTAYKYDGEVELV
jgi:hypothetical protein